MTFVSYIPFPPQVFEQSPFLFPSTSGLHGLLLPLSDWRGGMLSRNGTAHVHLQEFFGGALPRTLHGTVVVGPFSVGVSK